MDFLKCREHMTTKFKKREKVYSKLKNNSKNVRFIDFIKSIELFGFKFIRQTGSHRQYARSDIQQIITVQPNKYDKSKAATY